MPTVSCMTAPTLTDLAGWLTSAGEIGLPAGPGGAEPSDAERIDTIAILEKLKNAFAAAQGRVAHDFEESQRRAQREAGVPASRVGAGIAAQVALARHESPQVASTFLGLHRILATEMPHTARALSDGTITEYAATLLARETACLAVEHRRTIDELVVGSGRAAEVSRKQLVAEAHQMAARLDSAGVAERQAMAEKDRRVTVRPAPDLMTYVTALVPMKDGVAIYAALKKAADTAVASGDGRTRGQIMADTTVELLTGRSVDTPPPVALRLVMTERTLLRGDAEPAVLPGYGVLPAPSARALVRQATSRSALWVTRLYTAPGTGQLMAVDSRRRKAPKGTASFVIDRDQLCRTPWCGAPLRHVDHVEGFAATGGSAVDDLQGLCEACNQAKEAVGWSCRPLAGPDGTVEITTPTGHRYLSRPPPFPGGAPPGSAPGDDAA
jgi:hypothetical protein